MKVCHLINSFAVGGAEQTICNLIEADDEMSYTVCGLEGADDLGPRLRAGGADVHRCRERFRFDPRALVRLRRILSAADVDLLHTHLPYAHVVGRLVAPGTGVEAIVGTHHTVQDRYHPLLRWPERATVPRESASVAVSDAVRESFSDRGSGRSWHTIPNGIPVERFRRRVRAASAIDRPGSGPVFLTVGRCVPAKSQSVLVDAMAELVAVRPEAHLVLVGDGPLLPQLRRRVARLGLEDNVEFVGRALSIEPYYAAADAFVLPSRTEGLPITVLEAMAAGLPVVASDIPGVNDVAVDGETARLVPPEDPSRLARAMRSTVETQPRRMGRAGADRVANQFDIDRTMASYLELYRSVT